MKYLPDIHSNVREVPTSYALSHARVNDIPSIRLGPCTPDMYITRDPPQRKIIAVVFSSTSEVSPSPHLRTPRKRKRIRKRKIIDPVPTDSSEDLPISDISTIVHSDAPYMRQLHSITQTVSATVATYIGGTLSIWHVASRWLCDAGCPRDLVGEADAA